MPQNIVWILITICIIIPSAIYFLIIKLNNGSAPNVDTKESTPTIFETGETTPTLVSITPDITFDSIKYSPIESISRKDNYPILLFPQNNSKILTSRLAETGRIGKRGFLELEFDNVLMLYFGKENGIDFYNNHFLHITDALRYEPDHILNNKKINLWIDIEIDEPYEGISKLPTHYIGSDDNRNFYFNNNGWIVIRFAEIQILKDKKACCKFIANMIKSVMPNFEIPEDLLNTKDIFNYSPWTFEEAANWAQQNFRSQYLGIDFKESAISTSEIPSHYDTLEKIVGVLKRLNPEYNYDDVRNYFDEEFVVKEYYLEIVGIEEKTASNNSKYYIYHLAEFFYYDEDPEDPVYTCIYETRIYFERKMNKNDIALGACKTFLTPPYFYKGYEKNEITVPIFKDENGFEIAANKFLRLLKK